MLKKQYDIYLVPEKFNKTELNYLLQLVKRDSINTQDVRKIKKVQDHIIDKIQTLKKV